MENLLPSEFKPIFDLALSILPADVAKRLIVSIWQIESYDTLKDAKVEFPNGYIRTNPNGDDSIAWCARDNQGKIVKICLSKRCLEYDEPKLLYYILHELAHAIEWLEDSPEKVENGDGNGSEVAAILQVVAWIARDYGKTPYDRRLEIAQVALEQANYWIPAWRNHITVRDSLD